LICAALSVVEGGDDCEFAAGGERMWSLTRLAMRLMAGLVLLFCVCRPAAAQDPAMYDLAKQTASALVKAGQTNVVVVDFVWVDGQAVGAHDVSALGERLGNDFRVTLLHESAALQVETRARTMERLQEKHLVMENLRDPAAVAWLLDDSGTSAWVIGKMSSHGSALKIDVSTYLAGKYFPTAMYEASIPLTDELKALIREPAPDPEFAAVPRAGQNGVSYPTCIYCPQAGYADEAVRQKFGGEVVLVATIDETGSAKDVRVKVGLPFGLTQQAIDAVQKWRFGPAKNAEGKPVAVRQTIEVTFHLY
jgi:TonB family protein